MVVCCLIVQLSPIRVKAAAITATIASASTVLASDYIVIGSALAALGIYAGVETGAFDGVIQSAVSHLESLGGWIENNSMSLLKVVSNLGTSTYYVAGELLEEIRSWAWGPGEILIDGISIPSGLENGIASAQSNYLHYAICYSDDGTVRLFAGNSPFSISYSYISQGGGYYTNQHDLITVDNSTFYYWNGSNFRTSMTSSMLMRSGKIYGNSTIAPPTYSLDTFISGITDRFTTAFDLSLGNVPTSFIDGTSALDWSAEYDARQLRVIEGGGGSNPDNGNNNWKWWVPLTLAGTAAGVLLTNQEEQMFGETPPEFPEGDTVTEYEITGTPEIDGYQGLEISPLPTPNPGTGSNPGTGTDPDPGTGTNPDPGGDPGSDPDADPDPEPNPNPDPGTSGGGSGTPSSDPSHFKLVDLSKYFPFCIPFDLFDFFQLLNASPVAPSFSWTIKDLSGESYSLTVDLSEWDSVAQLFRRLQIFLFTCGLAAASRKFIKW